jgi:hypothetical protein
MHMVIMMPMTIKIVFFGFSWIQLQISLNHRPILFAN